MNNTSSVEQKQTTPVFSAGAFDILHFSPDPEGLQIVARGVGHTALGPIELTAAERIELGKAVSSDLNFRGAEKVRAARAAWREAMSSTGADSAESDALRAEFEAQRRIFSQKGSRVGFRNWRPNHNDSSILEADAVTVPFMVYNRFADPTSPERLLSLSEASGVAMSLRTADNRLIIQHRAVATLDLETGIKKPGNASYCDIPGASIAGMADATKRGNDRQPGAPDAVTTSTLRSSILKEASEELGLGEESFHSVRIAGIAHDNIKPHDEILFIAETGLTADEVRQNAHHSNRNKQLPPEDLEEKFFDIEASPEAIEALLADVRCPLPPTHAAAFVGAGFMMVLERTGSQIEAETWATQLESRIRANHARMDEMVQDYYGKHPEAAQIVPERMWSRPMQRNPHGYSPHFTPSEQGLPELEDELVRVGLVPETRHEVDTAYLFDVDGVLTNPIEKRVDHEAIFAEIIQRLQQGEPVAFNTGRSTKWVFENVIVPMAERIEDKTILQNAIIVGEKGGSWAIFDENGDAQHHIVAGLGVSDELQHQIDELITDKYAHIMGNLDPKQTMSSIEMLDGADLEAFHAAQEQLVDDLDGLLSTFGLKDRLRVDATTIATDVENPRVGKALGTERFIEFLRLRGIKPKGFVAFGDSPSDLAMTDELARQGKQTQMIYVGDPSKLPTDSKGYPVLRQPGHTSATAAYLLSANPTK